MSAFELAFVTASIYAAILWVIVQQRRIMDEQLKTMQAQLRGAERTSTAAHRPILRAHRRWGVFNRVPCLNQRSVAPSVDADICWCFRESVLDALRHHRANANFWRERTTSSEEGERDGNRVRAFHICQLKADFAGRTYNARRANMVARS